MFNRQVVITLVITAMIVLAVVADAVYTYDGRSQLTRITDCLHDAGYKTTVTHDDGRVSLGDQDPDIQLLFGDSDDMWQARDPSDTIAIPGRDSNTIALLTLTNGKVRFNTAPTPYAISRCTIVK